MINDTAIGLEHLCVLGMPPVEFVNLAADLGCPWIATGFSPVVDDVMGFGTWSLRDNPGLRREMLAAMRDRGVSISMGEGFWITPGSDIRDQKASLALWREMDVSRIGTLSFDPDLNRSHDQFAYLAEMAAEQDMDVVLEFVPGLAIADLPGALRARQQVNRDNFSILIDTLHLHRSGSSAADLATLPPGTIGYLQVCDAPLEPVIEEYAVEATYERLPPGEGQLPLLDILNAIPAEVFVGLELPMRSRVSDQAAFGELLQPCVDATRELLLQRS
ncbi:sugar phosphate isomerase/epimerase family protein [Haliea sp. E17]|uniref:sugar phosphate isomerase/epimerase family protein n=1 Tax=Haliea sp. E17 TaxID=3401576 RepID=UPI003AADE3F1